MERIATKLIRAGEPQDRICGAISLPIFQTAMFEHRGETDYYELGYTRLNNNPTHQFLQNKIATIAGGEKALVTSSGMAAISTTLLTVLKSGDHLLIQQGVYGGTYGLINDLFPRLGIEFDFFDATDPPEWEKLIKRNTRCIYVEGITNPILEVADHEAIIEFCGQHKLISIIDNTFLTPINFQPLGLGYDLSLHSGTKYLNGHHDIIAGVIIGSSKWLEPISHSLNHLGGCLDPYACFLLYRGIKTLELRMFRHNDNALKIAQFLENHDSVEKVNYPGLSSHPQHERAQNLFNGFSGIISFKLRGGKVSASKFTQNIKLATHAVSLGAAETLIINPSNTTHASVSEAQKEISRIDEELIRVSIGLEDPQDLIDDFSRILNSI